MRYCVGVGGWGGIAHTSRGLGSVSNLGFGGGESIFFLTFYTLRLPATKGRD